MVGGTVEWPLSGVPQMNQGIGSSLAIALGTAGAFESEALIKADGLRVLLVDIGRQVRVAPEGLRNEHAPNTAPANVRIDEQSLHVSAIEQHETDYPTGFIHREIERSVGKERGHFGVDRTAVVGCEEVVRRIDGAPPDLNDPRAVRRC